MCIFLSWRSRPVYAAATFNGFRQLLNSYLKFISIQAHGEAAAEFKVAPTIKNKKKSVTSFPLKKKKKKTISLQIKFFIANLSLGRGNTRRQAQNRPDGVGPFAIGRNYTS